MAETPAEAGKFDWASEPDYHEKTLGSDEFLEGSSDIGGSSTRNGTADTGGLQTFNQRSCASKAVNAFWGGAKFGFLAGTVGTAVEVMQWGLRGPVAIGAVMRGAATGAFAFGSGIGLYRGTICTCEKFRGVQDVGNAMLAGGVVGALSELPITLRAYLLRDVEKQFIAKGRVVVKPRPNLFVNTALGAAGCGMLYLLESSSKSSRHAKQVQPERPQVPVENNRDHSSATGWGRDDEIQVLEDPSVHELGELAGEGHWDVQSEPAISSGEL